ncbi:MAG: L,D-transpeptidase [Leptolyngbyaceae cyanobacterium]
MVSSLSRCSRLLKFSAHTAACLLGGLWVWGNFGLGRAQASAVVPAASPLHLEVSTATIAPTTANDIVHDPALFLPQAPQRVSRLVLRLSERRLYGYHGDHEIVAYDVAIGRNEWETPTGAFTVFQQQQHPAWEHPFTGEVVPPGPDNPLGARWIGFWTDGTNAIGFHGTPDEYLIGEAVSHGCVRLRNADVIELYDLIALGTAVVVLP